MLKKEIKLGHRAVRKNAPLRLAKAPKRKRIKTNMATGISNKRNPIVYDAGNPNHAPGKHKYHFNPNAPRTVLEDEKTKDNGHHSLDTGEPGFVHSAIPNISLPIERAQNTGASPRQPVERTVDSSSKITDYVKKKGDLVAFAGGSKSKKMKVESIHIEQEGREIPLPDYGSAPPNYDAGVLSFHDIPMPQAPAYQSMRSNMSINPALSNRILAIRGSHTTPSSVLGKRTRTATSESNKKPRTDDKPGGTLSTKRKRAVSPDVANKHPRTKSPTRKILGKRKRMKTKDSPNKVWIEDTSRDFKKPRKNPVPKIRAKDRPRKTSPILPFSVKSRKKKLEALAKRPGTKGEGSQAKRVLDDFKRKNNL